MGMCMWYMVCGTCDVCVRRFVCSFGDRVFWVVFWLVFRVVSLILFWAVFFLVVQVTLGYLERSVLFGGVFEFRVVVLVERFRMGSRFRENIAYTRRVGWSGFSFFSFAQFEFYETLFFLFFRFCYAGFYDFSFSGFVFFSVRLLDYRRWSSVGRKVFWFFEVFQQFRRQYWQRGCVGGQGGFKQYFVFFVSSSVLVFVVIMFRGFI